MLARGFAPAYPSGVSQPLRTADDLDRMPEDGWKHELQAGVLVSEPLPSPRHGRIAAEICARLHHHARSQRLGVVIGNDSGFLLARSPDTVRGPDVAFVSRDRYAAAGDPVTAFPGAPDLAIEVLSPSNTPAEVRAKVADYLAAGTQLVWVVDAERRTVTAYRSLLAPRILMETDVLEGEDVVPVFRLEVAEIFEI